VLISEAVYNTHVETLKDNASAISRFIRSGVPPERFDNFLYGFSHSAGKNIIIIDAQGEIVKESIVDDTYNTSVRYVDKEYCENVLSGHENVETGTLGNVYKADMFTLQLPVVDAYSEQIIGAIFISTPAPEMSEMKWHLFKTMGIALVAVLLISMMLSYALSRRISRPIKGIGKAVRKFANGDFSSRVEEGRNECNITEIGELADSFNNMAFHLEKAEDIRNSFISDVSHELRTPMTSIGGFVDGILDGTIPEDRQKEYLTIVKSEVSRLSSLVNSFLDVTRNADGRQTLEISDFDINQMIRRVLFGFENRIREKEISAEVVFEFETSFVKADKDAITRVLTNLIENAIKFTDHKGTLRISTVSRQQEVFVSVYNTGCGIPEEDRKLIFERFYKVDKSRSVNREGTGIGLYIVREILNRHGKSISVTSTVDEYAEFVFPLDKGKILI
jgi:signal transduction histidine kinase